MLIKLMRVIVNFIPVYIMRYIFNIIAKLRFKVKIGAGSVVRYGNFLSGENVIMQNTEISHSRLGLYTYVANNSIIRYADIGSFTSIGDYVRTCLGQHPIDFFSSHPQTYSYQPPSGEPWVTSSMYTEHTVLDSSKYVVKIGNDVWIGNNVMIMDGVTIGDGAIIAAGSIVTKDVEPYVVCAGIPAKAIKSRFDKDKVDKLLELRWWDKSPEWIKKNIDYLHSL